MQKTNNFLNNQMYVLGEKEKRKVFFDYKILKNKALKSALFIYSSIFFLLLIGMLFACKQVKTLDSLIMCLMLFLPILIVTLFPIFASRERMKEKDNYVIYKKFTSYGRELSNYEIVKNNKQLIEEKNYKKNDFDDFDEYIAKI